MTANVPKPATLARLLHQLGNRMADEGDKVMIRAPVLAARGWPASTNGTDGGRSSDPTSSTERAALNPGPYDGVDQRLREKMRLLFWVMMEIHASFDLVMSQASDDDPIPAGTGTCLRCEKFCRPDGKRPHNRIVAGFCPACYQKWWRMGKPDRSWFIRLPDEEPAA